MLWFALLVRDHGAGQKIEERVAACAAAAGSGGALLTEDAAESEGTVGGECVVDVFLHADILTAEDDLVLAQHEVYVVDDGHAIHVEGTRSAGAAVRSELAAGDPQSDRIGLVYINSEAARVET